MADNEALFTMAVAARLTGMHPQTLRKYERAGLINPARPSGNQRLYSAEDIERLKRIQYLVEEKGVNIAGLELALNMSDRLDELSSSSSDKDMRTAIREAGELSRKPSVAKDQNAA